MTEVESNPSQKQLSQNDQNNTTIVSYGTFGKTFYQTLPNDEEEYDVTQKLVQKLKQQTGRDLEDNEIERLLCDMWGQFPTWDKDDKVFALFSMKKLTLSPSALISEFEYIKLFSGLYYLDISGTNITDLKPLITNKQLRHFILKNTEVQSLDGCQNLRYLQYLDIQNTKVDSLAPISHICLDTLLAAGSQLPIQIAKNFFKRLDELTCLFCQYRSDNKIIQQQPEPLDEDEQIPFADLYQFKRMFLSSNSKKFEKLELDFQQLVIEETGHYLCIQEIHDALTMICALLNIKDENGVEEIFQTTHFKLTRNVTNLSFLVLMPKITHLDLSYTSINNIKVLKWLKYLKFLNLSHTNVSDILPLSQIKDIKCIDLDSTPFSDFQQLVTLQKLVTLNTKNTKVGEEYQIDLINNQQRITKMMQFQPIVMKKYEDDDVSQSLFELGCQCIGACICGNIVEPDICIDCQACPQGANLLCKCKEDDEDSIDIQYEERRLEPTHPCLEEYSDQQDETDILINQKRRTRKLAYLQANPELSDLFYTNKPVKHKYFTAIETEKFLVDLLIVFDYMSYDEYKQLFTHQLLQLDICNNKKIYDVQFLQILPKIQKLNVSDTNISDLSPISVMTNLAVFQCQNSKVAKIDALRGIKTLQYLDISFSLVDDLCPIANHKFIHTLFTEATALPQDQQKHIVNNKQQVKELLDIIKQSDTFKQQVKELNLELEGDIVNKQDWVIQDLKTIYYDLERHERVYNLLIRYPKLEELCNSLRECVSETLELELLQKEVFIHLLQYCILKDCSKFEQLDQITSLLTEVDLSNCPYEVPDANFLIIFQKLDKLLLESVQILNIDVCKQLKELKVVNISKTKIDSLSGLCANDLTSLDCSETLVSDISWILDTYKVNIQNQHEEVQKLLNKYTEDPYNYPKLIRYQIQRFIRTDLPVTRAKIEEKIKIVNSFPQHKAFFAMMQELIFQETGYMLSTHEFCQILFKTMVILDYKDASQLQQMYKKTVIQVNNNPLVSDLSFVILFPQATHLEAAGTKITNINICQTLKYLQQVNFARTEIKDLHMLKTHQYTMQMVNIQNCNLIEDLSPICNYAQQFTTLLTKGCAHLNEKYQVYHLNKPTRVHPLLYQWKQEEMYQKYKEQCKKM